MFSIKKKKLIFKSLLPIVQGCGLRYLPHPPLEYLDLSFHYRPVDDTISGIMRLWLGTSIGIKHEAVAMKHQGRVREGKLWGWEEHISMTVKKISWPTWI